MQVLSTWHFASYSEKPFSMHARAPDTNALAHSRISQTDEGEKRYS